MKIYSQQSVIVPVDELPSIISDITNTIVAIVEMQQVELKRKMRPFVIVNNGIRYTTQI